jgi:hypothetical protein
MGSESTGASEEKNGALSPESYVRKGFFPDWHSLPDPGSIDPIRVL